jgi:hypothetical protein
MRSYNVIEGALSAIKHQTKISISKKQKEEIKGKLIEFSCR